MTTYLNRCPTCMITVLYTVWPRVVHGLGSVGMGWEVLFLVGWVGLRVWNGRSAKYIFTIFYHFWERRLPPALPISYAWRYFNTYWILILGNWCWWLCALYVFLRHAICCSLYGSWVPLGWLMGMGWVGFGLKWTHGHLWYDHRQCQWKSQWQLRPKIIIISWMDLSVSVKHVY